MQKFNAATLRKTRLVALPYQKAMLVPEDMFKTVWRNIIESPWTRRAGS